MAFKILIRRKFKDATLKDISAMLIQARSNAMKQEGYISSESLVNCDDPSSILVISMWHTKEDWENYRNSATRKDNERKYAEVLEGETQYEAFKMGLT
jgi:heme-degrading monooxygenase HmoA